SGLQTQTASQQRTISERDGSIADLNSRNSALNQQVNTLTQTVTERNAAIEGLRRQGVEQTAEIERLNTQLTNIRQTLQTLTEE
ncbi:MAG: hypothetical protein LBT87_05910, partial [Treponema sp.]|nr:hypothetical protein [Treponema sp.]